MKDTQNEPRPLKIQVGVSTQAILQEWKSSLETHIEGISVTYSQLIQWAIEKKGPSLSKKDEQELRDRFFDKVKELQWLLRREKKARKQNLKVLPQESGLDLDGKREAKLQS